MRIFKKPLKKLRRPMKDEHEVELGLILLGASKFLMPTATSNPAFFRSKNGFKAAVASSGSLTEDRTLDLFDRELSVGSLVDEIERFLRLNGKITDLIIYYCGHGGFTKKNEFFLTLKNTRK